MKTLSIDLSKTFFLFLILVLSACNPGQKRQKTDSVKPNFVLIYCDDLGYGDLGCYGSKHHKTPHLNKMAEEGNRFTSFYSTSGVCTPSRSSLMTGCYAQRVDMDINARPYGSIGRQVLFPKAKKGLHPDELTIAELLKEEGYVTACIGKWHLGDQDPFLPTRQGFDYYYGIPYSNDMNRDFCPLPLMQQEKVIEAPADQNTLTKRYTFETIRFIEKHKNSPFFVYLPHAMTHNPLHASDDFRGKSDNGIYGDAVEELDWSTGRILQYLKDNNLEKNTLVMFSSDNGAASRWGGSNQPLSGWKGSTMEGGMRVPCIMWWPGTIPSGLECPEIATTMDILPTFVKLAGSNVPNDRLIDGENIFPLMTKKDATSPYDVFYFYQKEQLQAVRSGQWKLHLALDSTYANIHRFGFRQGRPLKLVNLAEDIKEEKDLAEQYPDIVKKLQQYAHQARNDMGDLGEQGENVRPAAIVEKPVARLME